MADFTIEAQLERCRAELLAKLPGDLGDGNCYITAASVPVQGFGRLYVQLFDDGASYGDSGSGQVTAEWRMGVAIRTVLVTDQVGKYIASSKELRHLARTVRNALHMLYDPDRFPDPPAVVSHTPVRQSPGSRGEAVIELRFNMLSIERYAAIKAA